MQLISSRETNCICICLIIFYHAVSSRILRRSCGDYAKFSYVVQDQVLQGEKLVSVVVLSEEECESACVDHLNCKSINVEKSGSARQCDLNRKSLADASDGVSLTPKTGWVFKSTSYTENLVGHLCKQLNPCEAKHLCIDVCYSPGYKCTHCEELYLGLPCVRSIRNIAFGKSARQSSQYSTYDASKAVDGSQLISSKCIHTEYDKNPWWSVDLAGSAVIFSVTIHSRTDCCYWRVSGLHVKLGYENHASSCERIWITPTFSWNQVAHTKNLSPPKKGKYMFIVSQLHEYLDMCEVEVMGYLE